MEFGKRCFAQFGRRHSHSQYFVSCHQFILSIYAEFKQTRKSNTRFQPVRTWPCPPAPLKPHLLREQHLVSLSVPNSATKGLPQIHKVHVKKIQLMSSLNNSVQNHKATAILPFCHRNGKCVLHLSENIFFANSKRRNGLS